MKQADSKIMQQYSKRDIDITPPCPNDSIEYVELSSSNNDDDATYQLLLLSNEVRNQRGRKYAMWVDWTQNETSR